MADEIRNLARFNVLGVDYEVAPEDKEELERLQKQVDKLSKFDPNMLFIETYSDNKLIEIFNLKNRRGHLIKWLNSRGSKLYVKQAFDTIYGPTITWAFEGRSKIYKMKIRRFIEIYKKGEFKNIEPYRFEEAYFIPVSKVIEKLNETINDIKNKYDEIYKNKNTEVNKAYRDKLNTFDKLEREAKAERKITKKDISLEDALKNPEVEKGVERVKSYWSTKLSNDEKAKLMGWVASNIYSIRIYALLGGQSGNALGSEYGDMSGIKLREPKYNDNNERTSQDSIGGYVYFKSIKYAPIEIFEKIASNGRKFTLGGGTVPNRFADKNFALFLMSEYGQYGFVPGKRNLYKEIDIEGLRELFSDSPAAFEDGLLPF